MSDITHPTPTPAHREARCVEIFSHLQPRLSAAGVQAHLFSTSGLPLSSPAPSRSTSPPSTSHTTGNAAIVLPASGGLSSVWVPVGRVKTDAWLLALCPTPAARILAQTLPFQLTDAEQVLTLTAATSQSGDRLAHVYEQMHVMFGLTRLLDGQSDAHQVVAQVLAAMRGVLDFGYLAVRFGDHPRLRAEVAGRLILSAEPPRVGGLMQSLAPAAETLLCSGLSRLRTLPPNFEGIPTEIVVAPVRYESKMVAVLVAGEKQGTDPAVSSFDTRFLAACSDLIGVFNENLSRLAEQRALFMGMVRALTASIDAKHRYTRGHSERVSLLAAMMAAAMGLPESVVRTYRLSGLLHDVGKIGVPEAILSKPSKLSDEEFEFIKRHPTTGHEILRGIPGLEDALPGVLHHHEQFGGRGYPDGLVGEAIPLIGRVLALCDTFDAMSSSRSYRSAMSRETVLVEITKCAGRQFDPALAPTFVAMDFSPFDALFAQHGDESATLAA